MTWHSDEDFVRDLASLDDFGVSKNSYRILYSFGRGMKTLEKPKFSNVFLDPRSGEALNLEEELGFGDTSFKSKGRGRLLDGGQNSKFQLQKQLRMARPLGSSDDIIESYCRRYMPTPKNLSSTSHSEGVKSETSPESSDSIFHSEKPSRRVKATRNSKFQNNALITSLLNKLSLETEDNTINKKKDGEFINEYNFIDFSEEENESDNFTSTSCSTRSGGGGNKATELEIEKCDSEDHVSMNRLKSQDNSKDGDVVVNGKMVQNERIESGIRDNCGITVNLCDVDEQTRKRNDIYFRLGKRLKRERQLQGTDSGSKIYGFGQLAKYLTSEEIDSDHEQIEVCDLTSEENCFHSDNFPPLRKRGDLKL